MGSAAGSREFDRVGAASAAPTCMFAHSRGLSFAPPEYAFEGGTTVPYSLQWAAGFT